MQHVCAHDADGVTADVARVAAIKELSRRVKAHAPANSKWQIAQYHLVQLLRNAELFQLADRIESCRKIETRRPCKNGSGLFTVVHKCKHFLCLRCSRDKAFKVSKEAEGCIEVLRTRYPGLKVFFGVFTLPSCEPDQLDRHLSILISSFRKLLRLPAVKAHLIGGVRMIEVTYNPSTGMFHPHLNVIFVMRATYLSRGYLSEAMWLKLWQSVTDCAAVSQIWLKRVRADPVQNRSLPENVARLVRYSMKPLLPKKWTGASLRILTMALRRRRLVEFFGELKTIRREIKARKRLCFCNACRERESARDNPVQRIEGEKEGEFITQETTRRGVPAMEAVR